MVKVAKEEPCEARIQSNPWDTEGWEGWVRAQNPRPTAVERKDQLGRYVQLLSRFPTAGRQWASYIRLYIQHGMGPQGDVESKWAQVDGFLRTALQRFKCMSMELWLVYARIAKARALKIHSQTGSKAHGTDVKKEEKTIKELIEVPNTALPDNVRLTVESAFEEALLRMGYFVDSKGLWLEYISFLKSAPTGNQFEEMQRLTKLRAVYQRALKVPMQGSEKLMTEYEEFESSLVNADNEHVAKQTLAAIRPSFSAARAVYNEMRAAWDSVKTNMLARPMPPPSAARVQAAVEMARKEALEKKRKGGRSGVLLPVDVVYGKPEAEGIRSSLRRRELEAKQITAWRRVIELERADPLQLPTSSLVQRIRMTYRRALCNLRFLPELWFEYVISYNEAGTDCAVGYAMFERDAAATQGKAGTAHENEGAYLETLKKSMSSFDTVFPAMQDNGKKSNDPGSQNAFPSGVLDELGEEKAGGAQRHIKLGQAVAVIGEALQVLPHCLSLSFGCADFFEQHGFLRLARLLYVSTLKRQHARYAAALEAASNIPLDADEQRVRSGDTTLKSSAASGSVAVLCSPPSPLVPIFLMRFERRSRGPIAARKVFRSIRRMGQAGGCTWHVYAAAAQIEFFANKEPEAAIRVMEAGTPQFSGEPAFLLHYAMLLRRCNDDRNLRVFFERLLVPLERRRYVPYLELSGLYPLWASYMQFEGLEVSGGGDLTRLAALEIRINRLYNGSGVNKRTAQRTSSEPKVSPVQDGSGKLYEPPLQLRNFRSPSQCEGGLSFTDDGEKEMCLKSTSRALSGLPRLMQRYAAFGLHPAMPPLPMSRTHASLVAHLRMPIEARKRAQRNGGVDLEAALGVFEGGCSTEGSADGSAGGRQRSQTMTLASALAAWRGEVNFGSAFSADADMAARHGIDPYSTMPILDRIQWMRDRRAAMELELGLEESELSTKDQERSRRDRRRKRYDSAMFRAPTLWPLFAIAIAFRGGRAADAAASAVAAGWQDQEARRNVPDGLSRTSQVILALAADGDAWLAGKAVRLGEGIGNGFYFSSSLTSAGANEAVARTKEIPASVPRPLWGFYRSLPRDYDYEGPRASPQNVITAIESLNIPPQFREKENANGVTTKMVMTREVDDLSKDALEGKIHHERADTSESKSRMNTADRKRKKRRRN